MADMFTTTNTTDLHDIIKYYTIVTKQINTTFSTYNNEQLHFKLFFLVFFRFIFWDNINMIEAKKNA